MADSPAGKTPTVKKELSMELRLLIAFILMGAVLFLTPYLYKPAAPAKPAPPAPSAPVQAEKPEAAPQPAAATPAPSKAGTPAPIPGAVAAAKESDYYIQTELATIRFSNRGATVRSWVLKKYNDDLGKPLELVNERGSARQGVGFPLSLVAQDAAVAATVNQALFAARPAEKELGIDYEFSDGKVFARKSFRFRKNSYLAEVNTELIVQGAPAPHLLAWRGGFGDAGVENASSLQHSLFYDLSANKLNVNEAKVAKDGPVSVTGNFSFAGLEDAYFAAVALPRERSGFEIRTFSDTVPTALGQKEEPHVGAAIGGGSRNQFSLFVGPKNVDILRQVDPKLEQLVDFGWFAFLARPLFLSLNWVNDKFVRNYGWSIVLVTVVINFLLLPLKFSSLKSMKKMSSLQPQIAAINEKYKGLSLRDPRKTEQNQEIMELYKKSGVNPMGGCFPMLLQIPFFIAFYKVLSVSIEMRGASWLWVGDLSRPETLPIRILPVAMIATQFILQKMTPSTTADPSQQRIMLLMPLMLGFMFYGVSSGLVLYWLTGNVVSIAQQWFLNRAAAPATQSQPAPKKAGARK